MIVALHDNSLFTFFIFLGDSLIHSDRKAFSSYISGPSAKLAKRHQGGWWYQHMNFANLNRKYGDKGETGLMWYTFGRRKANMEFTEMKFRPVN